MPAMRSHHHRIDRARTTRQDSHNNRRPWDEVAELLESAYRHLAPSLVKSRRKVSPPRLPALAEPANLGRR
jgi:hypothetical protein